ncbi:MAG: MFS transporter [Pseudomonadota bacterium]
MLKILTGSWPLFFGLALIMIGNGLQGTLLGIRANIEGFDTVTIGIIMSLYYIGFLGGSYYAPKLVSQVGHIRVFTALASLASTTVLLHGLFPEAMLWAPIRFFTGFAYAGLYIVVESWLNDKSTNKTRGTLFGIYQFIGFGGMMLGQYLLNISDPSTMVLFVTASVLVSIALVPVSLSSRPAPNFEEPETMPIRKLFKISPLGLAGVFMMGIGASVMFGIGAVYATEIDMTLPQISTFMALFIAGGALSQVPIGWLSDKYDRRLVLIGVSFFTAISALLCWLVSGNPYILNFMVFTLGFLCLPLYGLSMAHINDHLNPKQFVSASSSAILVNGMGSAIGPLLIPVLMGAFGTFMFFPSISAVFLALGFYGIWRMTRREAVPLEEQGDFTAMPVRATPLTMAITEEGHSIMKELEKEEKKNP